MMEVEKLKVAELRVELSKRGLDTKGTKPILVARLKEALQNEASDTPEAESSKPEEEMEEKTEEVEKQEEQAEQAEEPEPEVEEQKEEEEEEKEEENPEESEEKQEEEEEKTELKVNGEAEKEKEEEEEEPMETSTNEPEQKDQEKDKDNQQQQQNKNKQQRRGQKRRLNEDEPFVVTEDEPEINEEAFVLDWYNSDLNLKISKDDFMTAEPLYKDGWGYVWAGAKSTYGFTSGKICFEVKLLENMDSRLQDEKNLHELRIGFSTDEPNFQLGESKNSFCYSGTAKKGTDCAFEDYGVTFAKDDVVGAFLDLDSEPATLTFTKNGESQKAAFEIPKEQLEGKALFPHVSTRNIKFNVNFGKALDGTDREPHFPALEGYTFAAAATDRVRGPPRIKTREECEMIMMIGLPAAGKTTWVNKHVAENPEKRYNVIGTASLIEKMKVNGAPRKANHEGRWDLLIQKCTRCLQDWLRLASQRRRNVIIDQTNVYPNAQKRKVRPFEGMIRKAVVIVPSDEEYKARALSQEKAQSKDVPDSAVMEMKANFALPPESTPPAASTEAEEGSSDSAAKEVVPETEGGKTEGDAESGGESSTPATESKEKATTPTVEKPKIVSPFVEIIFSELEREEAQKLVEEYNKMAKEKGYGKRQENRQKRPRGNNYRMNRGRGGGGMRGGRNGPNARFRGGPAGPFRGGPRGGMPNRGFFRGGMAGPRGGGPMPFRGGPFMGGPQNRGGGGAQNRNNQRNQPRGGGGQNQVNRFGPNQQRFGNQKMGGVGPNRNQWGPEPPAQWSQWNQPQRPAGWGPWNQGGGAGATNPAAVMGGGWNQNQMRPMGGNQGGNFGGNFGGGSNWGSNQGGYNQGYPGNSNWGGGGSGYGR